MPIALGDATPDPYRGPAFLFGSAPPSLPRTQSVPSRMNTPEPSRLQVDTKAQTLTVDWADGHTSVFPLSRLRAACPCAECQGDAIDRIDPPAPDAGPSDAPPQWTDLEIEPAGSVGIRITWDDGHNAGIFRWDRLWDLQPPGA